MIRRGGPARPRLRILPTVLLTVAILGLPGGVYAWGRSSSSFAVRHVSATGTRITPERRVERLLRREYLGRNLFAISAADVRRALAPLSYVAGASVDRDFPDTLRVTVVEHRPLAYGLADGRWYVVADDGTVVCEVGADADAGEAAAQPAPDAASAGGSASLGAGPPNADFELPRLRVPATPAVGSRLDDPATDAALQAIAALPRALRRDLEVVKATRRGALTLRFAGGTEVAWGDASRPLAKALALRAVLSRYATAGTRCAAVDVSIPERVLARPVLK